MPIGSPDLARMTEAIREFLRASGVPSDDPELAQTPERVAAAWAEEFLDGYGKTVAEALGTPSPAPAGGGLIVVTHLDYTGICPHHLLPYRGVAHVAYRPRALLAGFGRIPALVDALAHRLTLQETLASQIAAGLVEGLQADGAGVVLEAEQTCMTLRGEKRTRSRTVVEATSGTFDAASFERLWAAIQTAPEGERRSP